MIDEEIHKFIKNYDFNNSMFNVNTKSKSELKKNLAEELGEQFILDPDDWINVEDQAEIVAVFHSHPNHPPTPSQADLASCEYLDLPFYLVEPKSESIIVIYPSEIND